MGKYIKEMLSGDDGKISSGKVLKTIAFFVAIIFCFIQIGFEKDITGIVGWLLGFAAGAEVANKIGNGLQSIANKNNTDIQGK